MKRQSTKRPRPDLVGSSNYGRYHMVQLVPAIMAPTGSATAINGGTNWLIWFYQLWHKLVRFVSLIGSISATNCGTH